MSKDDDRRERDIELLNKSFKALEAEQRGDVPPAKRPDPDPPYRRSTDKSHAEEDAPEEEDDVVMYRGRPVRKSSGGTPGSGSGSGAKARQFRGAGTGKKKKGRSSEGNNLKAALAKLVELHEEGLITKAEYDAKRRQILDRL